MQDILSAFRVCFKQWFPQRNLIVVSEHKVKHIPISGGIQCSILMVLAGLVCWGAYSTGNYMAVRMAYKSQSQALRSIADQRVATNFSANALYPAPLTSDGNISEDAVQSLSSPMFTLSALDNDKLVGRVAFLEKRVNELQSANNIIIQRVREKTAGRMTELEGIIRQVGMNPASLKKELSEQKPEQKKAKSQQGGPYIPADVTSLSAAEVEMYHNLDEVALLQEVVDGLPLSIPVKNADEKSLFGNRIDPFSGRLAFHSGVDLSGPSGSRIYATAPGRVTTAGRSGAYGNMVDIEHGFDISTRYGHMSRILVSPGQIVKKGELIGIQGSTGRSTGEHLHYEVRYHDRPLNPKSFLKVAQYVSKE